MLKLLKGDDTGGVFGRKLQFTIQVASGISLDGCYGEFIFDGITKRFDGPLVSGQTREIFYSHNETAGMALGVRMGAFVLVDAAGKRATVGNTYAVKVTNIVSEVYTTPTQTVEIYGAIKWSQIEEKPDVVLSVNGVGPDEDGNVEVTAGAADWDLIENKPEYDGEDLPEEFTEEQMRTKLNDVLDFLRDAFPAAVTAVAAAMCFAATAYGELVVDVTKARKGDLLNSAMIVTNVTVSGSGGIDTNAVRSIVNAEVGGTNTLVHSDDLIATTNAMEAAGTDSQIMRAKLLDDSISLWDIYSSRSASADKAYNIDDYYWTDGTHPTTLEGYGITDALSSSGGWTLNGSASFGGYVYLMEGWNYLRSTAGDTQTLPEYLTSGAWNTKTDTNKFLTVGGALAASDLWSESNAKLTNRIEVIATPIAEDKVGTATNIIWNAIGDVESLLDTALGGIE